MTTKKLALLSLLIVLVPVIIWVMWGNTALMVHEIAVTSGRLPEEFSGFRIAQISDLHNAEFGRNQETLLRLLSESRPDIIVITGDLIDSRRTDADAALAFVKGAVDIAPTYYVTGNHEARVPDEYQELERNMEAMGVHVLRGEVELIEKEDAVIQMIGVDDPDFDSKRPNSAKAARILEELEALKAGDAFTVLLSHRPELFDTYAASGVDLVFSGHAHGGQVRLPFVGGIIAPGQGLFPKYDAGLYTSDNTNMVVSRGIGNSIIPVRFNNRPEIVVVELSC